MNELLSSTLRDELTEGLSYECYDILDEIPADELSEHLIEIARRLMLHSIVNYTMIVSKGRRLETYRIKINNRYKGFVSISDDCSTAVSTTCYYPFKVDEEEDENEGYYSALLSLADMINEAWYSLVKE